eukprot:6482871-Amphidinium_carterae.1
MSASATSSVSKSWKIKTSRTCCCCCCCCCCWLAAASIFSSGCHTLPSTDNSCPEGSHFVWQEFLSHTLDAALQSELRVQGGNELQAPVTNVPVVQQIANSFEQTSLNSISAIHAKMKAKNAASAVLE